MINEATVHALEHLPLTGVEVTTGAAAVRQII